MDLWKYFAIGHERHLFCNPLSEAKVDELVALLALSDEARVLDIACGKAEFLVRTVKRWSCSAFSGSGPERVLQEEIYGPPYFLSAPLQVVVARLPHLRHQL